MSYRQKALRFLIDYRRNFLSIRKTVAANIEFCVGISNLVTHGSKLITIHQQSK